MADYDWAGALTGDLNTAANYYTKPGGLPSAVVPGAGDSVWIGEGQEVLANPSGGTSAANWYSNTTYPWSMNGCTFTGSMTLAGDMYNVIYCTFTSRCYFQYMAFDGCTFTAASNIESSDQVSYSECHFYGTGYFGFTNLFSDDPQNFFHAGCRIILGNGTLGVIGMQSYTGSSTSVASSSSYTDLNEITSITGLLRKLAISCIHDSGTGYVQFRLQGKNTGGDYRTILSHEDLRAKIAGPGCAPLTPSGKVVFEVDAGILQNLGVFSALKVQGLISSNSPGTSAMITANVDIEG